MPETRKMPIYNFITGVQPTEQSEQQEQQGQTGGGVVSDFSAILLESWDVKPSAPGQQPDTILAKIQESFIPAFVKENGEYQLKHFFEMYAKNQDGNGKGKAVRGYIPKEIVDELDSTVVDIPQNFAGLEAEMVPTRLQNQLFRIYSVVEGDDYVEISARLVWYDNLQNYTLWKPDKTTKYTAAACARNILSNAVSPANTRVASDCTEQIIGKDLDFERKNLVEAFLDPENGLCKKFDLSMIRDNWDCYVLKEVGYNRGFVVEDNKNLLGVERTESIDNVATRVCPYGKAKNGDIIWLNNNGKKWIDSEHIGDYVLPRVELYDTKLQIDKDDVTERNIQQKLLEAGQKRFSEDHVDLPSVEMKIEFLSLGDTEEYAQYRGLDKVYLYDIISIKDKVRGYQYTAQVVAVEHDILTGMLNSVTIGKLDNWDGTRKIAVWQVPEIDGQNIRLKSIIAGTFAPGAIQSADIGQGIIQYAHFASATIDDLVSTNITAVTAQIHQIIAGSITADDIQTGSLTAEVIAAGAITTEKLAAQAITAGKIAAGAITTEKLDAYAVTAAKIAAGAITADKIDANAITADKISATDLAAINAKLGTATIAQAEIATADINFAHIKDLNAESAYFGQAVFDEAVGGKLYVPRLAVGYAQMIGATIGDLVIQASNGNFYGIDVDLNGDVIATQRTVTAGEIASGHTTDGRTLVLGTDILATDLNTENIYASHALMNEITAAIINVDQLWAREAFVGKLMTTNLMSNTYIQATVGNWTSGSTITQTINSLDARISELGYGTIFMQDTEPDHSGLVAGDVWVQTTPNALWNEVNDHYATWQAVYNSVSSWQALASLPIMRIWDGQHWQEMYDSLLPETTQTQIQQLSTEISLRATTEQVDALGNTVNQFEAELTVQSREIQAAVTAVDTKASSYVMWANPRTAYTVSIGDIWVKQDEKLDNWQDLYDAYDTWQEVYDTYNTSWKDLLGATTYVWNGAEWVESSDIASEILNETRVIETERSITLLATQQAVFEGDLYTANAQITVVASEIRQEVARATNAEGGKLDKTTNYQTADAIVTEAERRSATKVAPAFSTTTAYEIGDMVAYQGNVYRFKVHHNAGAWNASHVDRVTNVAGSFIAKTSTYQTADQIVSEAVRQADASASDDYIAKTTNLQTADAIKLAAERKSATNIVPAFSTSTTYYTGDYVSYNGEVYKFKQTHNAGVWNASHVDKKKVADYVADKAYLIRSGIQILAAGVAVSGDKYIKLDVNASNYVHIDRNGIDMKGAGISVSGDESINLDVNQNNYVHMSKNGIDMKGSRVIVNDCPMWARDDIIVMNPNAADSWRRTVTQIESHMNGKHDWVLIRPYYDASINYVGVTGEAQSDSVFAAQWTESGSSGKAFGGQADWYNYAITLNLLNNASAYRALTVQIFLANKPFTFIPGSSNYREQAAAQANVIIPGVTGTIGANGGILTMNLNSGHVGYNLCGENQKLYYYINGLNYADMRITGVSMVATTDRTNGRVPCTTYYYS